MPVPRIPPRSSLSFYACWKEEVARLNLFDFSSLYSFSLTLSTSCRRWLSRLEVLFALPLRVRRYSEFCCL